LLCGDGCEVRRVGLGLGCEGSSGVVVGGVWLRVVVGGVWLRVVGGSDS